MNTCFPDVLCLFESSCERKKCLPTSTVHQHLFGKSGFFCLSEQESFYGPVQKEKTTYSLFFFQYS